MRWPWTRRKPAPRPAVFEIEQARWAAQKLSREELRAIGDVARCDVLWPGLLQSHYLAMQRRDSETLARRGRLWFQ